MRNLLAILALAAAAVAWPMVAGALTPPAPPNEEKVRELYVPFEDLNVLLEGGPQRVLISREEYQGLLEKARQKTAAKAPREAVLVSAEYAITGGQERADITGTLIVNVLEDGLHIVPLDVASVGLRSARLDDKAAALGLADDGRLTLFVEGKGSHTLILEMVAPLQMTAATQVLSLRLPAPAAVHMTVTVPGDVEVKSGAPVVSRVFDAKAAQTRFELLPPKGDLTLVMTLNSRLKRQDRVVVARSVVVDEVTQAYERLHATVSLAILHRAVDKFRFAVPEGFEVTDVQTPLLARWAIQTEAAPAENAAKVGTGRILEVQLREETTDPVVLTLSAVKTPSTLEKWSFPHLEPLDVVGHVAVIGLVLEERLKAEDIAPAGLIPIDTSVLTKALPATVLAPDLSSIRIRPIVAYYAPQGDFGLTARFIKPPAKLLVTTNLLLTLEDKGQQIRGALALMPEAEKVFAFDFSVPAGWDVTSVTADNKPLPFERYEAADKPDTPAEALAKPDKPAEVLAKAGRIHVRLPEGLDVGQEKRIYFTATSVPKKWFGDWRSMDSEFPVFIVAGADRDTGAIAIDARDDMTARADILERLVPAYDFSEAPNPGAEARLAFRFEGHPWRAHLVIERAEPRLTAQTFSFFKIERDAFGAHYEVVFDIAGARTRSLSILLPKDTPTALRIRGLDGVVLKEYTPTAVPADASAKAGERRSWTATLAEPRSGRVRLAIDFQSPLAADVKELLLPVIEAGGVAYQTGLLAVEGSAELQVQVADPKPRDVDVGELVDAEYQPGKRLLGTYGFIGAPPPLKVLISREAASSLPPALVQKAGLVTSLSAAGTAQSAARFLLRTKAQFLEIQLPPHSTLWAVRLDGRPAKPQREGDRLLLSLPAASVPIRDLQVVYEFPAEGLGAWKGVEVLAPKLTLHAAPGAPGEDVPTADLQWVLYLPSGYCIVRSEGTVTADHLGREPLALAQLASALWKCAGGAGLSHGLIPQFVAIGTHSADEMVAMRGARAPAISQDNVRMGPVERSVPEGNDEVTDSRKTNSLSDTDHDGDRLTITDGATMDLQAYNQTVAGLTAHGTISGDITAGSTITFSGGTLAGAGNYNLPPRPPASLATPAPVAPGADRVTSLQNGAVSAALGGKGKVTKTTAGAVAVGGAGGLVLDIAHAAKPGERASGPSPTATTPPLVPPAPAKPQPGAWALEGVSSLFIDIEPTANATGFRSLGAEPRLELTVADFERLGALGSGLALMVLVGGLALTRTSARRKIGFIVVNALVATAVPVLSGEPELAAVTNGMFWAALALAIYYPVFALVRWLYLKVRAVVAPPPPAGKLTAEGGRATLTILLAVGLGALALVGAGLSGDSAQAALAAEASAKAAEAPYVVQIVPPPAPVKVPDDALLVPYDPAAKVGLPSVDKLLVPYDKFVDLWNRANPENPIETHVPPAPYAVAGAAFTATLKGDDFLLIEGSMELVVYTDGYAVVPLPLSGGVLAKADLDGKPAQLSITEVGAPGGPVGQGKTAAVKPSVPGSFLVLYATGKGRHKLDLEIRLHLEKQGGWRVAGGFLPAAPATAVTLKVPDAGTEVRLGAVRDRRSYDTKAAGETIATALDATGAITVQWRPKVAEGQLDQALTATGRGVFDIQEDQRRVRWALTLDFRKGEREFFTISLPAGYLVEKVEGSNVRGWEVRDAAPPPPAGKDTAEGGRATSAAGQQLEVGLLKPAKERETFTVVLWQPVAAPTGDKANAAPEFDVPVAGVVGAVRQTGYLQINRSPMLSVRTVSATGVTRADLAMSGAVPGANESPLGLKPYQAYDFAAVPFSVKLAAEPVTLQTSAVVQTILRLAERERKLESRTLFVADRRPLYRARLVLPADLRLDHVQAPGEFEWAVTEEGGRKILTVYMATGVQGDVSVLLDGKLGEGSKLEMPLPHIEVLDVDRQEGDTVVQVDPSLEIRAEGLKNVESVPLARTFTWLNETQRPLAQLALHHTQPDFSGRLVLVARKPDVGCFTVSNSRVTDRTIQDTILLDWTIKNAGIKEVVFLLPAWMKDARISVPLLRQKTVQAVDEKPGSPVRVTLQLQDEVMDNLRVLVENDRLLSDGKHDVPIPVVETGRTDRRYVALESAGRDEVVTDNADGLEPLSREQKEWAAVSSMLRGGQTQAFIVAAGAERAQLVFHAQPRKAVETARARIGLAQTGLIMDATGAYRAMQVYRVDNRMEPYLEVQMPEGATLWTASVAGEAVKPFRAPGSADARVVRIPLIKTAAGELDYAVVLKYAGQLKPLDSGRYSVSFPLIHTVNIRVELSQVELYLPKDYTWFDFSGANRVTEEGAYEAVGLQYLNKQAKSLVETTKFGNEYEKVRAAENVRSLQWSLDAKSIGWDTHSRNKDLQEQVAAAEANWKDIDKALKAQPTATAQLEVSSNGSLISEAYGRQHANPSSNLVTLSGANTYSGATNVTAGTLQFNDDWLRSNRLDNASVAASNGPATLTINQEGGAAQFSGVLSGTITNLTKAGAGRLVLSNANGYTGNTTINAGTLQVLGANNQVSNASGLNSGAGAINVNGGGTVNLNGGMLNVNTASQAMLNDLEQQANQSDQGVGQVAQANPRSGKSKEQFADNVAAQTAQRYQQKLAGQQQRELTVVGVGGGGNHIGGFEGLGSGSGRGQFFGAGTEEAGAAERPVVPAPPTGLASLDIDLPKRGTSYRFTMPGDVAVITGRTVSTPAVDSLERLGEALLLVLAAIVLWRFVRRAFKPQALSRISTAMIFLGVVGIMIGILPVASLVVIVWGVVIKFRLRQARRRAVAA